MLRRVSLGGLLCAAALFGASSCRKDRGKQATAVTPTAPEVAPASLPTPPQWTAISAGDYAVPSGCRLKESPRQYVQPDSSQILFISTPGDLRSLAVGFYSGDASDMTSFRGVWDLSPKAAAVGDLPWLKAAAPPIFASFEGRWIAVLTQADAFTPDVALWLWREGKPLGLIAHGDRLVGYDARCDKGNCVVMTSRPAMVAVKGASAWTFGLEDQAFARADIALDNLETEHLTIASFDGVTKTADYAASDGRQVLVGSVGPAGTRELGRVAAENRWIDASGQASKVIVVGARGKTDEAGCTPGGSWVVVGRPGAPELAIATQEMAVSGYARAVGGGFFVTWIAPVNCRSPKRKVVWGQLIGAEGQAVSSAMAIGDADGHAIASSGDEIQIWLRREKSVISLSARCENP